MLGLVRAHVNDSVWRSLLLVEMCARAVKVDIRKQLRQTRGKCKNTGKKKWKDFKENLMIFFWSRAGIHPYKVVIIDHLNRVFGHSADSDLFWGQFRGDISAKFPFGLTQTEDDVSFNLRDSFNLKNWRWLLYERVKKMLGLQFQHPPPFASRSWDVASAATASIGARYPFDVIDLEDVVETVKQVYSILSCKCFITHVPSFSLSLSPVFVHR